MIDDNAVREAQKRALRIFTGRITDAIEEFGAVPRGARGRVLFQSFLALATAEKGAPLTVREVTLLCAEETQVAVRIGAVKS